MSVTKENRGDERMNLFKCLVCGREALRGKYIVARAGVFRGYEAHVCTHEDCKKAAKSGKAWSAFVLANLKNISILLVLVVLSACGKPQNPIDYGGYTWPGKSIASAWKPMPNPTQPAVLPLQTMDLTKMYFNVPNQITILRVGAPNPCYVTATIKGDESSGVITLTGIPEDPICGTYSQTLNYSRLDINYFQFDDGTNHGLYQ